MVHRTSKVREVHARRVSAYSPCTHTQELLPGASAGLSTEATLKQCYCYCMCIRVCVCVCVCVRERGLAARWHVYTNPLAFGRAFQERPSCRLVLPLTISLTLAPLKAGNLMHIVLSASCARRFHPAWPGRVNRAVGSINGR